MVICSGFDSVAVNKCVKVLSSSYQCGYLNKVLQARRQAQLLCVVVLNMHVFFLTDAAGRLCLQ